MAEVYDLMGTDDMTASNARAVSGESLLEALPAEKNHFESQNRP